MAALFEKGKTYTFYFSREHDYINITGEVISYDPPLVKIETDGLNRIINCSSAYFVEAVARRDDLDTEDSTPAE